MPTQSVTAHQEDEVLRQLVTRSLSKATAADFQVMRQDPAFKRTLEEATTGIEAYVRGFVNLRMCRQSSLQLRRHLWSGESGLVVKRQAFDWLGQDTEEKRFKRVEIMIRNVFGVPVVLQDHVPPDSIWPSALGVLTTDLARQRSEDPEKLDNPLRYSALIRPVLERGRCPRLRTTSLMERCLQEEKPLRLAPLALESMLTQPSTQEKGAPLIIRRLAVNPAVRFKMGTEFVTFEPRSAIDLLGPLPEGSPVKVAAAGDVLMVLTFLTGELSIVKQLNAKTCPGIEAAATLLYHEEADNNYSPWSYCASAQGSKGRVVLHPRRVNEMETNRGIFAYALS